MYPGTLSIVVMTLSYAYMSSKYFGHNWSPKSGAEMICDGITFMLAAMAALAYVIEKG